MSKQSNQRYRKEKEKENLKKAGIADNTATTTSSLKNKEKDLDE